MAAAEGTEIGKGTFKRLVRDLCEEVHKDRDLDVAFDLADTDRSGTISMHEFIVLYSQV